MNMSLKMVMGIKEAYGIKPLLQTPNLKKKYISKHLQDLPFSVFYTDVEGTSAVNCASKDNIFSLKRN